MKEKLLLVVEEKRERERELELKWSVDEFLAPASPALCRRPGWQQYPTGEAAVNALMKSNKTYDPRSRNCYKGKLGSWSDQS